MNDAGRQREYWAALCRDCTEAEGTSPDDDTCGEALELVKGPQAQKFARALDQLGWMIVEQPKEFFNGSRWLLDNLYGPVPKWAEDNGLPRRWRIDGGGIVRFH